ncbi:MAG: hypothetical protein NTW75_13695 [Planctomycetales bacterium]|jgi:hypothetical protein|nr:hypothetical protein [Planctomycetales bacterium]
MVTPVTDILPAALSMPDGVFASVGDETSTTGILLTQNLTELRNIRPAALSDDVSVSEVTSIHTRGCVVTQSLCILVVDAITIFSITWHQ